MNASPRSETVTWIFAVLLVIGWVTAIDPVPDEKGPGMESREAEASELQFPALHAVPSSRVISVSLKLELHDGTGWRFAGPDRQHPVFAEAADARHERPSAPATSPLPLRSILHQTSNLSRGPPLRVG